MATMTPVTALPANGVTTGSVVSTSKRMRLEVYAGASPLQLQIIRMLASGDWAMDDVAMAQVKQIRAAKSSRVTVFFDVQNVGDRFHVLAVSSVASDSRVDLVACAQAGTISLVDARHERITNAPAASLTSWISTAAYADGALAIAAQPVVPAKMQIRVVDANSSITAGLITAVYIDQFGIQRTEVFNQASGGTKTWLTTWAVAKIISVTLSATTGSAGGATDTVSAGPSAHLGLPGFQAPVPGTFSVFTAHVDDVAEAVGTVDATAGTISPTTAPDGSKDFDFRYTYAVSFNN